MGHNGNSETLCVRVLTSLTIDALNKIELVILVIPDKIKFHESGP